MIKAILPLILLSTVGCGSDPEPPSDAQLIRTYNEKKEIFYELRDMMCRDRLQSIYLGGFSKPKQVSEERSKSYIRLLKDIGGQKFSSDNDCNISISAWSVGSGGVSKTKGYTLRPRMKREIVNSLDDKHTKRKYEAFFHMKLEGEWYLYYYDWL